MYSSSLKLFSLINVDKVIVGTSNLPKDYHASLFSALKRTLNSLGFIFPVSASATPHQYWTSENGRWGSNVYTSLFPFFVNYGGAVLLALETFFGFIYGAMWKFLKSKAVTWSAILVYADLFFYYIAMFSIAERILSQLFTITSLVEILFIFLLLRGLTRPKTVE